MIENIPSITFTIRRGDTYTSPKYTFFNEEIPPGITQEELDKGIAEGIYTYRNWNDYQVDADVFMGDVLVFTLTDYMKISEAGRYLYFQMSADETKEIAGKFAALPAAAIYDLQACHMTDQTVYTLWRGEFKVIADITQRDVCGGATA
ncbi:hypothetical protein L2750_14460 [Shewanella submarina]|uniref:Uncharacterized protein n=1 Tax=Shewanella submarina TaxID=2016376 RepID=A0ABV7G9Y7_9GAMM|nr:hypothetical protein [Shewanella submarina]MCL1038333.1 hypothetical protein [Shewanella submarina]